MIGYYARDAYQAIRQYIVAYWSERARTLSKMGVEGRQRKQLMRSSPAPKRSASILNMHTPSPQPRITTSPVSRVSGKGKHTYHIDNDELSERLKDKSLMEKLKVSSGS